MKKKIRNAYEHVIMYNQSKQNQNCWKSIDNKKKTQGKHTIDYFIYKML